MPTELPDLLFHYTTLPGILGIVQDMHVRATSIGHLADATEFNYAHGLLEEALRTKVSGAEADVLATVNVLLKHLGHAGRSQMPFGGIIGAIFVASFSTERDLLSQWRAYCPDGGYAIGFRTRLLEQLGDEQGFELRQCSYNEVDHRRVCEQLADEVLAAVATVPLTIRRSLMVSQPVISVDVVQALHPIERQMVESIQAYAPTWKHPSFREEAEWRLVSKFLDRQVRFRAGKSAIVPYVEFRFDGDTARSGGHFAVLGHTVVGPCPEPELAVGSAMLLFEQHKIAAQEFSISRTPYRSW